MLKQDCSNQSAPSVAKSLSAACLSAFLVFGNAVSAFGNAAVSANPDDKASTSKTAEANKRKETSDNAASDAKNDAAETKNTASSDSAAKPAQTAARKSGFTKVGDPFLVATADAQQTQTSPQTPPGTQSQTPAQTDATRPPGTEQNQSVPPTSRTNPPANPQTPPGTQQPVPQSPPGVQQPTTNQPPGTTAPNTPPTAAPNTPTNETTTPDQTNVQEPNIPAIQPRPVPPLPSLERVGVIGTDTLSLTMNEAIRRALENNNDIESSRADVRIAEQQLIALRGVYDPVFLYQPQINNSIRPVPNIFGGAGSSGTVSTTDINNNASVNKQVSKGGGTFTYFFNNTRENTDATNTTLNPFYSAAQGLQFTQPLWRNRSIDRNRQQIRIQRKRLEQSDADFRRITIQVISQVQGAYWDLVFAKRNLENQIANVNLAREDFRRTEASVAAGASAPLARAEIETELSSRESALLIANQQLTSAENVLKQLIIKDPLSPDWQKVLTPTDQPSFDETPVNLDSALKEARENRPELHRLQLEQDVNAINLQFYKNQTKPQIDLVGTLQTNGLAGTPQIGTVTSGTAPLILGDAFATTNASAFLLQQLNATRTALGLAAVTPPNVTTSSTGIPTQFVGGYGQTLSNLFNFSTRQIVVGATISIPLHNRTAEANYTTAQIQRDQLAAQTRSQAQVIEVDVRNSVQAVETARQRVLAARQARASAEEQLAGERRLFQVGRSTQFLLFQRENELITAQAQELQAETDYNKALADLQRATSTTLRSNNVIIESPVAPEKFK
jgi:HAE1 family hydrophobic/amphiphilic exporter-1